MNDARAIDDLTLWLGMLEKVVDGSTNMVVVTDRERRIKWVNATYSRVTGWSLPECIGKRPGELLHGPQTSPVERSRLAVLMRQGQSVSNFELVNHKKSGEPYHVALNIEPIRDAHGEVCAYLSIQSDITERRQQERHTAELKQRLEVAQRLARLGRIDTEVESGRPRWSSEVFRILGMAPDGEPRDFEGLLAFAMPEDVADLRRSLAARVEAGEDIDLEFRVIGLQGQQCWVRCRAVPDCADGRCESPRSWSVQDITLYKARLEEKRQRNEELNQLVRVSDLLRPHHAGRRPDAEPDRGLAVVLAHGERRPEHRTRRSGCDVARGGGGSARRRGLAQHPVAHRARLAGDPGRRGASA
ncbi:MAG: hypothetical protein CVT97_05305 [Bacteroidetes bacterium HGW-Bacteroidetes-14]|nr:MAG: hypothetical protein CVT97_05305 [Bacteroidetes bacterium HGW-Bacteroidetes-14]